MAEWSLLTNHAWVLLCISHDPGVRLRDIAVRVGITERTAYGIVTDLTEAGYVVKQKDGRRNRYQIQAHLPLRGQLPVPDSPGLAAGQEQAITDAPSMTGKPVLVTGGTDSIGKATAAGLAARGTRAGITGRDQGRATAAAADMNQAPPAQRLNECTDSP